MRSILKAGAFALTATLALAVAPAQAADPFGSPTAWGQKDPSAAIAFQFKIPFGSGTRVEAEKPHFAFGMGAAGSLFGNPDTYVGPAPRLDLTTYGELGFRTMEVGGLSVVEPVMRLNADGTTTAGNEVNWTLVGAGLVAGTMALLAITHDSSNETPTCVFFAPGSSTPHIPGELGATCPPFVGTSLSTRR